MTTMENGNSLYARIAELEKENEELKKNLCDDCAADDEDTDEGRKNTKNTKDNRKCVIVEYRHVAVFKIPNDLDLEDESIVENWYVRYGTLHICYTNGEKKEIEWLYEPNKGDDYKRGAGKYADGKIEDADDWFNESDYEDTDGEDE